MTQQTQFTQYRPGLPSCDVVLGLDFGTSCTKAVIRANQPRERCFAVPFADAAHPSCPYFLPSSLWAGIAGATALQRTDGECEFWLRDLKSAMMTAKADDISPWVDGAAFLAHAIQAARGWFLSNHATVYQRYTLDWQLNLGLPSANFADSSLCERYLWMGHAAWRLSVMDQPITLDWARRVFRDSAHVSEPVGENQSRCLVACGEPDSAVLSLVPEVAAEAVGYAQSDLRKPGLHLMVDVGATTLDVCGFLLHKQGAGDGYALLTAEVQPLGAMRWFQDQLDGVRLGLTAEGLAELDRAWTKHDPVAPIPEDWWQTIPMTSESLASLEQRSSAFCKRCYQTIWSRIIHLKQDRDPNSPHWRGWLPVFLTGGGSRMKIYQTVLEQVSREIPRMYEECEGLDIRQLVVPSQLEGEVPDDLYHRLAIAWGLSFPKHDLGKLTRPEDIADVPRKRQISRDHLEIGKEVT